MRVEMSDLCTGYETGKPILENVSLTADTGQRVAVIGPSGAGKSTLLLTLAGFQEPWSGSVAFDGCIVSAPGSVTAPQQRGAGMVFQNHGLWPHLTVEQHLHFVLRARRIAASERARRVAETLDRVGLSPMAARMPSTLSGGEAQRLSLARAVVAEPPLLLLDEPLGALDRKLHREMIELIDQVAASATVIVVSHDISEAVALAQHLVVLERGRVQQQGSYRDLYARPSNSTVAHMCGDAALLPATVDAGCADTSIGSIPVAEGARGTMLLIRPDQIEFASAGRFNGTVRRCVPCTSKWLVTLDLKEDRLEVRSDEAQAIGAEARFEIRGSCHVLGG